MVAHESCFGEKRRKRSIVPFVCPKRVPTCFSTLIKTPLPDASLHLFSIIIIINIIILRRPVICNVMRRVLHHDPRALSGALVRIRLAF